jgi:hypothetical protein
MMYAILADATLVLHLVFILFVIFGGLLTLRTWRWALLHLPAFLWGATIEFTGGICPLTPLENWFRAKGGLEAYHSDFIQHYLLPIIYPQALTRRIQVALGIGVLVINILVYLWVYRRRRNRRPGNG